MRLQLTLASALVACLAAWHANAITLRDDVAAAEGGIVEAWDRDDAFPYVGALTDQWNRPSCTGTLIDPRVFLTAAHCFYQEGKWNRPDIYPNSYVSFAPDTTAPGAVRFGMSGLELVPRYLASPAEHFDLALVTLDRPLYGVEAPLLASRPPEVGELGIIVGYGSFGIGSDGDVNLPDGRRRWGTNIIEHAGPFTSPDDGSVYPILYFDFDDPTKSPATDREANTGRGDSGGPMLVRLPDGRMMVVAISRMGDFDVGFYGDRAIHELVSGFRTFIDARLTRTATSVSGGGDWFAATTWAGGLVPNNAAGAIDRVGRYYRATLAEAGTVSLSGAAEIDGLTVSGPAASLAVAPSGRLTVHGPSRIEAGRIELAGTLSAYAHTMTGGVLSGSGVLTATIGTGDLTMTGGVLAPGGLAFERAGGAPDATLLGFGGLTLGPNATFLAHVRPGGADRALFGGAVDVQGGALVVAARPGYYGATAQRRLLEGASATGGFGRAQIASPSGALTDLPPTGAARLAGVVFRRIVDAAGFGVETEARPYAEIAGGGAVGEVARYLDGLRPGAGGELAERLGALDVEPVGTLTSTLETLAPSANAVASQAGTLARLSVSQLIGARTAFLSAGLAGGNAAGAPTLLAYAPARAVDPGPFALVRADEGDPAPTSKGVWLTLTGGRTELDDAGPLPDRRIDSFALAGGVDAAISDEVALGVALAYSRAGIDLGARGSADRHEGTALAYGVGRLGRLTLDANASIGRGETRSHRVYTIGGVGQVARMERDAWTFGTEIGAAIELPTAYAVLTPYGRIGVAHTVEGRASETSALGWAYPESRATTLTSELGLRLAPRLGERAITPSVGLAWRRDTVVSGATTVATLPGATAPVRLTTPSAAPDRLAIGLALEARPSAATTLRLTYDGEIGRDRVGHALQARWRLAW